MYTHGILHQPSPMRDYSVNTVYGMDIRENKSLGVLRSVNQYGYIRARDRQTDKETEKETHTHTQRHRETHRETDGERQTDRETDKGRETERERRGSKTRFCCF